MSLYSVKVSLKLRAGVAQRSIFAPALDRPCRQAGEGERLPAVGQEVQSEGNVQDPDFLAGK